jgi:NAD+ synthase (glutamine-hydrolysing)
VVDVQLISDLHKSEVFRVAEALGVPQATRVAPPSADLWEGQTDEEELGFSYDFVELLTGAYNPLDEAGRKAFEEGLKGDARAQWDKLKAAAFAVHNRNKHKITGIANL